MIDVGRAQEWTSVVGLWRGVAGPVGSRVEIVDGEVTVAAPNSVHHDHIVEVTERALRCVLPEEWCVRRRLGLAVPSCHGLYVPDLAVVPRAELDEGGGYLPADSAELVLEITSWLHARHDRDVKLTGYGEAGVPFYLLVDDYAPEGPTITLHSEPRDGHYRTRAAVSGGEVLNLPAPFEVALDTSEFPTVE